MVVTRIQGVGGGSNVELFNGSRISFIQYEGVLEFCEQDKYI